MYINKTQVRQFLDELKFLNKYNKDYDLSIFELFKAKLHVFDLGEFLEAKRLIYNRAVVEIMNKYGIEADDAYSDLDKIWLELEPDLNFFKEFGKKWNIIFKGKDKPSDADMFLIPGTIVFALVSQFNKDVSSIWAKYKSTVYEKMEEYVGRMNNEQK